MKRLLPTLMSAFALACGANAQTHLPDDSDVYGDFSVGTTADKGGLTVVGKTGNSAPPGIAVTGDGGVLFTATVGTGQIPATGAGSRLMWYPKKAAFRVGTVASGVWYSTFWDDSYIGIGSFATSESMAAGENSVAMSGGLSDGVKSTAASGGWAMGMGGVGLAGMGHGTYAVGLSNGEAWGEFSTAMSGGVTAYDGSTAISQGHAYAPYSTAVNYGTTLADQSFATGFGAYTLSYGSFVVGASAPLGGENPTAWVDTDPQFVVGYGTGVYEDPVEVRNRTAFVIYKNGNARFTKRQGDILMGEFGTVGSGD